MSQRIQPINSLIDQKTFGWYFWLSLKEDFKMDFIYKAPPPPHKKIPYVPEEELFIEMEDILKWCPENIKVFQALEHKGYHPEVCNMQFLYKFYENIFFNGRGLTTMDPELLKFENLKILKLNNNKILEIANMPPKIEELFLYSNRIRYIAPRTKSSTLLYLGLGYNEINDECLDQISRCFPSLKCLDLCQNHICDLENTALTLVKFHQLKILHLRHNPISLVQEYQRLIFEELLNLEFFDGEPVKSTKKEDKKPEDNMNLSQLEPLSTPDDKKPDNKAKKGSKKDAKNSKKGKGKQQTQEKEKEETEQNLTLDVAKQELPEDFDALRNVYLTLNISNFENFQGNDFTEQIPDEEEEEQNEEGVKVEQKEKYVPVNEDFTTCYWLSFNFMGKEYNTESQKKLYCKAYEDPEDSKHRLSFDFSLNSVLDINNDLKNQFQHGFLIFLHQSEPQWKFGEGDEQDEEEKYIVLENGRPKVKKSVIGVIQMNLKKYLNPRLNPKRCFNEFFQFFPVDCLKHTSFQYPTRKQVRFLKRFLDSRKLAGEDEEQGEQDNKGQKDKKEKAKKEKAKTKTKSKKVTKTVKKEKAKGEEEEIKEVPKLTIETNEVTVMLKESNEIIEARKERIAIDFKF